jgi:hypothetical protein
MRTVVEDNMLKIGWLLQSNDCHRSHMHYDRMVTIKDKNPPFRLVCLLLLSVIAGEVFPLNYYL